MCDACSCEKFLLNWEITDRTRKTILRVEVKPNSFFISPKNLTASSSIDRFFEVDVISKVRLSLLHYIMNLVQDSKLYFLTELVIFFYCIVEYCLRFAI